MSDNDAFCGSCGAPAGQTAQAQTSAAVTYVSAAPKKNGKAAAVIAVILIILIAAVSGVIILKSGSNQAPDISAADIQGRWVRLNRYKNTYPLCAFTEDGRYVSFRYEGTYQDMVNAPIPSDATESWQLAGSDLIRIKGRKGKDQLIKVIFNYDKTEAVIVYLDDFRSAGGDITKCTEKYVRPEKYLELHGLNK